MTNRTLILYIIGSAKNGMKMCTAEVRSDRFPIYWGISISRELLLFLVVSNSRQTCTYVDKVCSGSKADNFVTEENYNKRDKLHLLIGPYTDKKMAQLFGKNCLSPGKIKFAGGIQVPGFASNALIY
ncbi:hypothetical protein WN51_12671 [Melipona quadrifasciata]|uniref:Uncharacterized protein n=1 Tax=Melipona quadrifasciata TaxID=166423 RepID=A0A0M9A116_9HYME|nr:hypothetical protein WN51_12671 [Melipona quadrifasciata]